MNINQAPSHPAQDFAARLAAILTGLVGLLQRSLNRIPARNPAYLLLWNRLHRFARHVASIMAREAAGRAPRVRAPDLRRGRARPPAARLPTEYGWLLNDLKHEAVHFGARLDALLAEPGMPDLLARHPYIARMLTPLRRALGLTPPPKTPPRRRPPPAPPTDAALSVLWPFRNPPPGFKNPA